MEFWIVVLLIIIYVWYRRRKKKENELDLQYAEVEADEPIPIKTKENKQKKKLVKRFSFPVVGLNYEGRRKILKDIIKQYKEYGMFMYEPYDGLTNKEILEDYYDERIYEISEGLRDCAIEKEDDNPYDPDALKVLVKDLSGKYHHIGYVPSEHTVEIRNLMDKYRMQVDSFITGGKYKEVDINDAGEEVVRTRTSEYGLNLDVSFWEE